MNLADLRWMLKLMADGNYEEVVSILRRRIDAMNSENQNHRQS